MHKKGKTVVRPECF